MPAPQTNSVSKFSIPKKCYKSAQQTLNRHFISIRSPGTTAMNCPSTLPSNMLNFPPSFGSDTAGACVYRCNNRDTKSTTSSEPIYHDVARIGERVEHILWPRSECASQVEGRWCCENAILGFKHEDTLQSQRIPSAIVLRSSII